MRKVLIILIAIVSAIAVFAQSPTLFKYQGVARDADSQPYVNTTLGMKISIVKDNGNGTGSGIVQYAEKHYVATSPTGVFSLSIGGGQTSYGDIDEINWGNASYWLKVEMDISGGEDFVFMGNAPILPVPLAMHAMTVEDKDDADADPQNEIQTLIYDSNTNTLRLTNGGQVDLSSLQGGGGSDNQTLQFNGTTLSIENGNQIDLSSLQGGPDADADPQNEIQTISFDPNTNALSISNGNTISIPAGEADADADPQNEIQTIELNGNNLVLSDGGGQVDLSVYAGGGGSDDQTLLLNGTSLSIENGNQIDLSVIQDGTTDADADPQNEIQTIELNGNNLVLSEGGGQVDLSVYAGGGGNDDQTLLLNGTNLSIENGNQIDLSVIQDGTADADADPQNEIQTISFDPNTNALSISDGNTISIPAGEADADADPENEIQELAIDANTFELTISEGNTVLLPIDNTTDNDHSPNNELQMLSLDGNTLSLSDGGGNINLDGIGGGAGSDDQTLQLNGTNLIIENGNQVDLSSIQDGTQDADANPQNEIQTINLNGNNLSLSNGGGQVNLSGLSGSDDQTLQLNGTNLIIENGNQVNLSVLQDGTEDADANPQNEIQSLQLNGNNLSLSNGGGQVNLAGIGGSSLWQENATNLFTDEKVAIGFEEVEFSHLEVKEDFSIYNSNGKLTVDIYSSNNGGNLVLRNIESPSKRTVVLGGDGSQGGRLRLNNLDGQEQAKIASSDVGGRLVLSNPLENVGISMLTESFSSGMYFYKPQGGNGFFTIAGNDGASSYYYGNSNASLVSLGVNSNFPDRGYVKIGDNSVGKLLEFTTLSNDASGRTSGVIKGFNSSNNRIFTLGAITDNQSRGFFSLYDQDTNVAIEMVGKYGGEITLRSSSGINNRNVVIGTSSSSVNRGKVSVHNSIGLEKAGMVVNSSNQGVLYADIKNFRMDHPIDNTKEIWYACVEGPEAAAYERGTAQLVNGEAMVSFPAHYGLVANHETMTVMLTPLSADCKGLAVVEKTATGFKVKELFHGEGTYQFDWEVKCVRKGYENYKAVRVKKENQ